jgi:1,4-dihydroxy-2-naphthoate octaprenyltransferase
MENEELKDDDAHEAVIESQPKATTSAHVVTAESVQAEEVPTIPLGSLQTVSALQPEISVRAVETTQSITVPAPLVVQPAENHRTLGEWRQIWWEGIRPSYFILALMPVVLGSILAWTQSISVQAPLGHFHPLRFIAVIIVVCLLQTGANLINDYYDYLNGVDTANVFGPGGLIQQRLVRPTSLLKIGLAVLGAGTVLGLLVAIAGGPLVYLFGLIGVLCAYFYSATARSLSSLALGELVGFLVFGPLTTAGAYIMQTGQLAASIFVFSLMPGFMAAAVIHVNNMRDAEGDAHVGKRTIASILGLSWSRAWFLVLLLASYVIVLALGVPSHAPHLLLITLWTLPTLIVVISGVLRTDTPAGLDLVMRQTLRLEVYFVLLLIAALFVTAALPVLPHLPEHLLPI